jgi:hypothetical protein
MRFRPVAGFGQCGRRWAPVFFRRHALFADAPLYFHVTR